MNTQNLDNSRSASAHGTIKVLGERTLIKLFEAEDHTKRESGLYEPAYENAQTAGGKNIVKTSAKKHLAIGTVLATTHPDLKIGDVVAVPRHAAGDNFFFQTDRTKMVAAFDGTILVGNALIECIYEN